MERLAEVVSALVKSLLPGTALFLLLGLSIGIVLLARGRTRRKATLGYLVGLAVLYWALATPLVAGGLERGLAGRYHPLETAAEAGDARWVVVLTGGGVTLRDRGLDYDILSRASAYRMLEAQRLYDLLDGPGLLISGGPAGGVPEGNPEAEAMRTELVDRGIPASSVEVEASSPDTHQQAIRVRAWMEARGMPSFVLVTSAAHMRRALGAFVAQGMTPIPSAALDAAPANGPLVASLIPSEDALGRSSSAIREVLALVYYRLRGWIR